MIIRVLIVSTFKLTRQERFYLDHRLEPQNTLSSVTSEADGHCGKPDARAWSSSHGMTGGLKEEEDAVGETDSIYSENHILTVTCTYPRKEMKSPTAFYVGIGCSFLPSPISPQQPSYSLPY